MPTIYPHLRKVTAVAAVFVLFAIAGCETPPVAPERGEYTTGESGIQRADQLLDSARNAASPQRDLLLLEAADIYRAEERYRRAGSALNRIDEKALGDDKKVLYLLLTGELALHRQDLEEAENFLDTSDRLERITSQPTEIRLRWHRTRGELFSLLGQPTRGIYELARASALLPRDAATKQQLHDTIWQLLESLPREDLVRGIDQSIDSTVAGWYQLGDTYRASRDDITLLVQNIRDWQRDNPQHAAAQVLPEALQQLGNLKVITPRQIAVLLPQSGEFEPAAKTLTDGMLAAYYEALQSGRQVPALRFYGTDGENITALYQRVVAAGAELVIGPLRRENLEALLPQQALPVPVLGLNYLEGTANNLGNLYQFGLSIQDEARQIAETGWARGHRSAMIVIPDRGMGTNAGDAFTSEWLKQGGNIIATTRYDSAVNDYTGLLKPALLVDQSVQRATRLKKLLGTDFDYRPRRRGDVDMIFLISYPETGRQIKPALDFLYAADLPVYSTSHIYSGVRNPDLDQDLNNILFTAMPWTFRGAKAGPLTPAADLSVGYRNLYAMGVDAYRLHQWLELLKALPENEIAGQTGNLSLAGGNRVQRRLPWARFEGGVPVAVPEYAAAGVTSR